MRHNNVSDLNRSYFTNDRHDVTDAMGFNYYEDSITGELHVFNEFEEVKFEYNMSHEKRGCFLIFNQENFAPWLNLSARKGTEQDVISVRQAARLMGFEYIRVVHDATRDQIKFWLKMVGESDHSPYDAFGCAILSHGDEGDVVFAKDGPMHITDFTSPFTAENCKTLARKPKLFFIQACRGTKKDSGVELDAMSPNVDVVDGMPSPIKLPSQADFMIACATIPGYMSWRNTKRGSWFIQALLDCVAKYVKTLELMEIMTRVNSVVAHHFQSNTGDESDGSKQIPSIASQLTAQVYFFQDKLDENANCVVAEPDGIEESKVDISPNEKTSKQSSGFGKRLRRSFRRLKGGRKAEVK
ncbi:unnamed protein product [Clavelina lepadiformis]|uniref:Caspase-3 n=1 Tax=Clavelina lepadiformis TaxID=159417 RepID=A0ABP0FK55_CLALP